MRIYTVYILWRLIRDDTDILALQNDINRIIQWCDKWSLKLNVKKCKHMSIAVKNEHQSSYHMSINGNEMKLDAVTGSPRVFKVFKSL